MVESPARQTAVLETDPEPADQAEDRGTLEVRNKALQRIVELAALRLPGTVAQSSKLGRITGMALPKADITAEGRAVRVKLDVAMIWPGNVTRIATAARDTVREEAFRLSGIEVRSVDVTVHAVDPTAADDTGRRVE
ncbi:Asp23/Gls24 family envelope stress response protein [Nocardioides panzhihuensis]|uniref:Putative alkaline shock family protein YloU n=1 Tax=Nocardioides panzhihuensis TaxID=860243 RepID=A0A7Z0DMK2_9ACTN|nr:putative alkaline shock family protein YloU [Nocardioides panzhihuensis]